MTLYNSVARHVMGPTLDRIRGCRTMACLKELEENQWWSSQDILALQQQRLEQTIQHAYAHVPYYRMVMQERGLEPRHIRTVADLARLPVLTKAIVRSHIDELTADNVAPGDLIRSRTGGSTGNPLAFFTTKHDLMSHGRARGLLSMEWAGVQLGDRVAAFEANFKALTALEEKIQPLSRRFRQVTHIPREWLADNSIDDVVQLLHKVRPKTIAAYPSEVALLAAHIRNSGQAAPYMPAILTGGEQIFEHQRQLIREVFGVEPFSRYGSRENYLMATECEAHKGLHVFAQDHVLEIVDDGGIPVAPGREGRVLITNLHARGMPFIRYDTGDMGTYTTTDCSCGRGMPLLDLLSGRRCDAIYTRSGRRFSGTALGMSYFAPLGASQFQVVQEDLDHLTARIVMPDAKTMEAQAAARTGAEEILRRTVGAEIAINVELVDHIEPSPAGKYVPIISKVDPNSSLRRPAS